MSAVPYDSHEQDWNRTEHEGVTPRGRPRRHFFNRKSAALAAAITCAAGFYAGIKVEKGQLSSSAPAATTAAAGAGATAQGTGAGGFAGRFGGGAGGNASIGTISNVNGNMLYLTETTGNTVKVTLSPSTKLTKSLTVAESSLHPGDSIVVQGVKSSDGTVVATSISDSGTRTTGTGGGTSSTTSRG